MRKSINFAFISFITLMLFNKSIFAASFDCRKARTSHEIFICANPSIAEADAKMGRAYRFARANVPVEGLVKEDQKLWLQDYRNCNSSSVGKSLIEKQSACLQQLEDRTAYLYALVESEIYTDYEGGFYLDEEVGSNIVIYEIANKHYINVIDAGYKTTAHIHRCLFDDNVVKRGNEFYSLEGQLIASVFHNKLKLNDEDGGICFELRDRQYTLRNKSTTIHVSVNERSSALKSSSGQEVSEILASPGKHGSSDFKGEQIGIRGDLLKSNIYVNFLGHWAKFMAGSKWIELALDNKKISNISPIDFEGKPGVLVKRSGRPAVGVIFRIEGDEAYPYALQSEGKVTVINPGEQFGITMFLRAVAHENLMD